MNLKGDKPLTGEQIEKIFNNKIKVIEYKSVRDYDNIEDLLLPFGRVAILYPWKLDEEGGVFGHWTTIFLNKDGNIEYFNSYGSFLEEGAMKNIDKKFKKQHGEDIKYLTYLLYNSNHKVEYNNKKLQSDKSNTCGRWVIYRLLRCDLNIKQFQKLFTKDTIKNDIKILNLI
jgi:hypothetical protein